MLPTIRPITNDTISYITSIMSFKISLMLTYLRFMPKGAARTATIVVIVLCILFHLAFLIIQLNLCHPVRPSPPSSSKLPTYLPLLDRHAMGPHHNRHLSPRRPHLHYHFLPNHNL